jgi:hypothetical protein
MNDLLILLPDFENLLKTKSFPELTSSEQSTILKFMSIEQYEAMRINTAKISKAFSMEDDYLLPDKNLKDDLLIHFNKKKENSMALTNRILFLFLGFKIPAYQAVIVFLAILFLLNKPRITEVTKIIPVSRTDTIFVEKIVNSPVSALQNQYIKKHIPYTHIKKSPSAVLNQNYPLLANIITHYQSEKTGHSVESDPNLYWQLVTTQFEGN